MNTSIKNLAKEYAKFAVKQVEKRTALKDYRGEETFVTVGHPLNAKQLSDLCGELERNVEIKEAVIYNPEKREILITFCNNRELKTAYLKEKILKEIQYEHKKNAEMLSGENSSTYEWWDATIRSEYALICLKNYVSGEKAFCEKEMVAGTEEWTVSLDAMDAWLSEDVNFATLFCGSMESEASVDACVNAKYMVDSMYRNDWMLENDDYDWDNERDFYESFDE